MHMISYPFLHRPEGGGGNPYVNGLFWVIYDRLATFTQTHCPQPREVWPSPKKSFPQSTRPLPALRCLR
jgi:hypothetical protein